MVKPAIGVESQEPFLLLVIGKDIDKCGSPFGAIDILELLEQDLNGLAVGSVHGEEVKAFGILWLAVSIAPACNLAMMRRDAYLDLVGSLADVELVGHVCCGFVGISRADDCCRRDSLQLRACVYIQEEIALHCSSQTDVRVVEHASMT